MKELDTEEDASHLSEEIAKKYFSQTNLSLKCGRHPESCFYAISTFHLYRGAQNYTDGSTIDFLPHIEYTKNDYINSAAIRELVSMWKAMDGMKL